MKQTGKWLLSFLVALSGFPLFETNAAHAANTVMPQIAAGYYHSVGLISDGTVWSWGSGINGELGYGRTVNQAVPIQASGLKDVKSIASGVRSSYAILNDGTVMAWGYNSNGQLGDGTTTLRSVPVQVSGLSDIQAVSVGIGYHALALDGSGNVWAWGKNYSGQLGDGTTEQRETPVRVAGLSDVKAVAIGENSSFALKKDGTVWAWGWNDRGQLGNGTTQHRLEPEQVPGLTNVEKIAAGGNHSLALDADGKVWSWGENAWGELGDGSNTNRLLPVLISGLPAITEIAGGGFHSLALDTAGNAWAWGLNNYGQLGDNTLTQRNSPIQIPGLSEMKQIAAGGFHGFAMKSDGTVWAWGLNSSGQLGDSTWTSSTSPLLSRAVMDATAPIVTDGTITAISVTSDGATLKWTKATDNMSEQSALQYLAYRSENGNIRTVTEIEQNGTAIGGYTEDLDELAIAGLQPGKSYYFNVVVKDRVGYKSAYTMQKVTTIQIPTDSALDPITGSYDKNPAAQADVSTVLTLNGNALIAIDDGTTVLALGGDYTISGDTVTIGKRYLASRPVGTTNLRFTFSQGAPQSFAIAIADTTPAIPGVPVLQSAVPGNGRVTLAWSPVEGATGYKIYQSLSSGHYGAETATVTGSVYSYDAMGLTNGIPYFFVVSAENPGGDSAASNEVAAVPRTVPAAPTILSASAGDGRATVSFSAPSDNGGNLITGYEVTSSPGNITATGTSSPITVTGLSNGTTYTFTVKAINAAGGSAPSAASNAVTPRASSGGSGTGGSGDKQTHPEKPPTPAAPETADSGVEVLINGKAEQVGTGTTSEANGRLVTTIAIDSKKLESAFAAAGRYAVITIASLNPQADIVASELDGITIQLLAQREAVLKIVAGNADYTMPARQIDIDSLASRLGNKVPLQEMKVRIEIATATDRQAEIAGKSATDGGFTLVVPPISFTVTAVYGESRIELEKFAAYVTRTIAIPASADANRITTGITIDPDGTVRHVPTKLTMIDGKRYARINSLTNSMYSVVWHPVEFKDVVNHWAKASVNDMGSRMVIDGIGNGRFDPDREMTRAEFATILVRGLGLKPESGKTSFSDVDAADWYSGAVQTAYEHGLINGLEDGTFRPSDKITREQAMAVLAKAMAVTGLKAKLPSQAAGDPASAYADAGDASEWAKNGIADCLRSGIVTGTTGSLLAPKAFVTRAEVAVLVQRLLLKSDLI